MSIFKSLQNEGKGGSYIPCESRGIGVIYKVLIVTQDYFLFSKQIPILISIILTFVLWGSSFYAIVHSVIWISCYLDYAYIYKRKLCIWTT